MHVYMTYLYLYTEPYSFQFKLPGSPWELRAFGLATLEAWKRWSKLMVEKTTHPIVVYISVYN